VSHCGTLLLNNYSAQLSINGQGVQRACSLLLDLLALAAQQFNEGLQTIFFDELRMDCQTNPPLLPSHGKRSSACRAPEWLSSPPLVAAVLTASRVQRHRAVVGACGKLPLAISQSPYGLFFVIPNDCVKSTVFCPDGYPLSQVVSPPQNHRDRSGLCGHEKHCN